MGRPKKINNDPISAEIEQNLENFKEDIQSFKSEIEDESPALRKGTFNQLGLREGINYQFNDIGLIDWPKMIDKQYLVANRYNFENRNQTVPTNIDDLEDKDKLILLAGFKNIALLRGYTSVSFTPLYVSTDLVSLECNICWRGNYETGYQDVCYSGLADASDYNTESFAKIYLTAIAENRAFVRAVRNFLNIPILGKDELGPSNRKNKENSNNEELPKSSPSPIAGPRDFLTKKLKERNRTFEQLKKKLIVDGFNAKDWNSELDIPPEDIVTIIGTYFDK